MRLEDAEQITVVPVEDHLLHDDRKDPLYRSEHPGLGEGGRFHPKGSGNPLPDNETLTKALAVCSDGDVILLEDGLYTELGRHCNELGRKLADGILAKGYELAYEPESNMIFPVFSKEMVAMLEEKVMFEHWEDRGDSEVIRLVTSWSSKAEDVEAFLELI